MVAPTRVNGGQVERDGGGARTLADDDVDPEVLHRDVEHLLGGPRHPVDLVEEQHLARLERRTGRRRGRRRAGSPGPLVTRSGTSSSAATIIARVVLPRPGGPESRTWSGALPRPPGGLEHERELLAHHAAGRRTRPGGAGAARPRRRARRRPRPATDQRATPARVRRLDRRSRGPAEVAQRGAQQCRRRRPAAPLPSSAPATASTRVGRLLGGPAEPDQGVHAPGRARRDRRRPAAAGAAPRERGRAEPVA